MDFHKKINQAKRDYEIKRETVFNEYCQKIVNQCSSKIKKMDYQKKLINLVSYGYKPVITIFQKHVITKNFDSGSYFCNAQIQINNYFKIYYFYLRDIERKINELLTKINENLESVCLKCYINESYISFGIYHIQNHSINIQVKPKNI